MNPHSSHNEPNTTFLQILRLPVTELWQVKSRRSNCISRGALQVLFSKSHNQFLLKSNDLYFLLDKSLQVTGTYSEKGKWHSFLIPAFDGFFIIKALDTQPGPLITNFETILSNTTQYSQRSGLDEKLGLYSSDQAQVIEKAETSKVGGFTKVLHAFTKILAPSSENDNHPNQKIIRSFDELIDVESPGVPIVDLSADELRNIKDEMDEVVRNHQGNIHWRELLGDEAPVRNQESQPDLLNLDMQPKIIETKIQEIAVEQPHDYHLEHFEGCQNIQSCICESGRDNQEVMGLENQRLPAYEVHHTTEHLERGFRKASINLSDCMAKETLAEDDEDTTFTSGLLSGAQEAISSGRTSNPAFERWGSNITNASESSCGRDLISLGQPTNFGNPNPEFTAINLERLNLNPPSMTHATNKVNITQFADRTNIEANQRAEKAKNKNLSSRPVDKENLENMENIDVA